VSTESVVPDRYLEWDAAYVLGALSPAERREFEQHLADCRTCQRAVSELAGMPGLLAQVTPEDAALLSIGGDDVINDPPRTLLPRLITSARVRRRRIALTVGAIAAALVLVLGGFGVLVGRGVIPIGQQTPYRLAFSPVVPSAITAVVDVIPRPDGTTLAVECQYGESNEPSPGGAYATYEIWVKDKTGHYTMLKDWPAKPNKVMRPEGMSTLRVWQINEVQIREAASDQVLLTAQLH
jgi:Putative zinc-finger